MNERTGNIIKFKPERMRDESRHTFTKEKNVLSNRFLVTDMNTNENSETKVKAVSSDRVESDQFSAAKENAGNLFLINGTFSSKSVGDTVPQSNHRMQTDCTKLETYQTKSAKEQDFCFDKSRNSFPQYDGTHNNDEDEDDECLFVEIRDDDVQNGTRMRQVLNEIDWQNDDVIETQDENGIDSLGLRMNNRNANGLNAQLRQQSRLMKRGGLANVQPLTQILKGGYPDSNFETRQNATTRASEYSNRDDVNVRRSVSEPRNLTRSSYLNSVSERRNQVRLPVNETVQASMSADTRAINVRNRPVSAFRETLPQQSTRYFELERNTVRPTNVRYTDNRGRGVYSDETVTMAKQWENRPVFVRNEGMNTVWPNNNKTGALRYNEDRVMTEWNSQKHQSVNPHSTGMNDDYRSLPVPKVTVSSATQTNDGDGYVEWRSRNKENNATTAIEQPRMREGRSNYLKLKEFTGAESVDIFIKRYRLCQAQNCWTPSESFNNLCCALSGPASQLLLESGSEGNMDAEELVTKLQNRYGSSNQRILWQVQLQAKRQAESESLGDLVSDVRRLSNLAFPGSRNEHSNYVIVKAYIDSLRERDIAGKLLEREPSDLDEAYRISLKLLAFKEAASEEQRVAERSKVRVRSAKELESEENKTKSQLEKRLQQVERELAAQKKEKSYDVREQWYPTNGRSVEQLMTPVNQRPWTNNRQPYKSYQPQRHYVNGRSVNNRTNDGPGYVNQNYNGYAPNFDREAMQSNSYDRVQDETVLHVRGMSTRGDYGLTGCYRNRPIFCSLDSGAQCSIIGKNLMKRRDIRRSTQRVVATNGTDVLIVGQSTIPLFINGMKVVTHVYVSSDTRKLILGLPWMQSNQLSWNMKENWIELRNRRIPVHCRSQTLGPTRINGLKMVTPPTTPQTNNEAETRDVRDGTLEGPRPVLDSMTMWTGCSQPSGFSLRAGGTRGKRGQSDVNGVSELLSTANMNADEVNGLKEPKATVKLPDDWDRATIAAEQEEDVDLKWVIRRKTLSSTAPTPDELRGKSEMIKRLVTQWDQLELCDGLLTRRWMDDDNATVRWYQLIPPIARRATLIQSAHGGMAKGPFGVRRTMKRLRRRAYWPGWTKDVRAQLQSCIPCASYKRDKIKLSLGLIPIVWDEPEEGIDVAPLIVTDPQVPK